MTSSATSYAQRFARRLGGFALAPLLGTLASLASLPVVARELTTEEWVTFAVAQSVGTVASVAVGMGWGLTGPTRLAGSASVQGAALLRESLATRIVAMALVTPVAAVVAVMVAPAGNSALAIAMTLATALGGLSPAWFYVGTGSPRGLLAYDVVPRVFAVLLAAALLSAGTTAMVYPLLVSVAGVAATAWAAVRIGGPALGAGWSRFMIPWLRRQSTPVLTELAGAGYSVASGALVATQVTVVEMADYASGWRLYLLALAAVVVTSQAFQGWVAGESAGGSDRRSTALRVHAALAATGLVLIPATGPTLTGWLFGGPLSISVPLSAAFGVAFLAVSGSTAVSRYVLLPTGGTKVVLHSTVLGVATGVPLILGLSHRFGAEGGAWGLAVSELAVLAWQVRGAVRNTVREH